MPGVLVMAKAPVPGEVKTRLEPLLGAGGCALLQRELIRAAVTFAVAAAGGPQRAWIAFAGEVPELVPDGMGVLTQRGDDLGARLRAAVEDVYAAGHDGALMVIGTDCPQLGADHAAAVMSELARGRDATVIPARDGGYCLIAMNRPLLRLFRLPPDAWGGPAVLELTLASARAAEIDMGVLAPERDLDTADDARAARDDARVPDQIRAALLTEPLVSIVVPVLDEEQSLPGLLDRIAAMRGRFEVVVVDGGSHDSTADKARTHPSSPLLVHSERGRAGQMNRGATAASGEVLLFLHADTRLPENAYDCIVSRLRDPEVQGGNFALEFDGEDRFSEVLGRWYATQRRAGIYYGDSALWVRREVFDHLGGYRPLPIMEDYDFVRRLEKRGRTTCIDATAVTSARRWKALGLPKTIWSWFVIRWLFVAGVSPQRLVRLYPNAR